jgi:hypothetical protein
MIFRPGISQLIHRLYYKLDDRGSIPGMARNFHFATASKPALGHTVSYLVGEADHLPQLVPRL